jgi:hypothetical protein
MSGLSPLTLGIVSLLWFVCLVAFGWSYLSIAEGLPVSLPRRTVRIASGVVVGIGVLGISVAMLTFLGALSIGAVRQLFN